MTRVTSALFLLISAILSMVCCGCSGRIQHSGDFHFPREVRKALPQIREAYEFAAAYSDVLAQMPCYCGCGRIGHTSDLDCFIERIDPDGTVHIDPMGLT